MEKPKQASEYTSIVAATRYESALKEGIMYVLQKQGKVTGFDLHVQACSAVGIKKSKHTLEPYGKALASLEKDGFITYSAYHPHKGWRLC